MEDPSDEELVDWGEEEDYFARELVDDEQFLGEENFAIQEPEQPPAAHYVDQSTNLLLGSHKEDSETEEATSEKNNIILFPVETQSPNPLSLSNAPRKIRKSDRPKKPSARWNEDAGFVQQPPQSTKKKNPKDPREVASNPEATQRIKRSQLHERKKFDLCRQSRSFLIPGAVLSFCQPGPARDSKR